MASLMKTLGIVPVTIIFYLMALALKDFPQRSLTDSVVHNITVLGVTN
jgi:hypothetical protein